MTTTMTDPGFPEVEDTPDVPVDGAALAGLDRDRIFEATRSWPADRKAALLSWLKARHTRHVIQRRYAHPAELARSIDPSFVETPAITLISKALEQCIREPRRNLLVTMPPQEGKSSLCSVWAVIRALQLDPDTRVILATYADALAEEHSTVCRGIIAENGTGVIDPITGAEVTDKIGLSLGSTKLSHWRVKGGKGGLVAVGLGSSITGRAADLLIIDDPYKNMQEADSKAHRAKVETWMKSVAFTRLSPDASVVLIQTRWHPEDLAGSIMASENQLPRELRTWKHINIPAVSDVGVPDALRREPETPMISARGRTAEQWRSIRRNVGERVWYALYEGVPTPPEGGLFSRSWFNDHRLVTIPPHPVLTVVAVDPAETGKRDEAGIVAASLYGDRTAVFTHDRSGSYTSDQWAKHAVRLALEVNAREIAVESYTAATTYKNVVKSAWREIHEEITKRYAAGEQLEPWERRALSSTMPFKIHPWRGTGSSEARSVALRQAFETGTARVAGASMAEFEDQAATWQQGQHQPDRVAAGVIAHDRIVGMGGQSATFAPPVVNTPVRAAPAWLTRKL